jgi:polyphosphate kinase
LLERLKFLAIFSSNNDEFYRVRVASLRRLQKLSRKSIPDTQFTPDEILSEIQRLSVIQNDRFNKAYESILKALEAEGIRIVNEESISLADQEIVIEYFKREVLPYLFPVIIDDLKSTIQLKDRSIYLAVKMSDSTFKNKPKHAVIEVPSPPLNRFYMVPTTDGTKRIMFLDDVIRLSLKRIFSIFDYDTFEAYTIKLTRDAEFTINDDENTEYKESLLNKIQKSLKQRSVGSPTRFVYDAEMPRHMQDLLIDKLNLRSVSTIPGGRYHNFKDFMDFPKVGNSEDYFEHFPPLSISELSKSRTMFDAISLRDYMLHHPYQSFDYVIRLLREAAIDPQVESIKITLYRVAKYSNVVNSLINAIKNGKKVTVLMELQARFDEEANIYWTTQLQEAGARVHFGKAGQKVHSKVCLIYRKEDGKLVKYAHLSTGNYNAVTSRLYCDHGLLTKDERLTQDIEKLMDLLFQTQRKYRFDHLLVAPDYMAKQYLEMIDQEIRNAQSGKPAYIIAKMNSLVEESIVKKLYEASRVGVKIDLIVRGVCSVVPGIKGLSENIRIISIIDRFLEHARVFIFCNNGSEKLYLLSADWMHRNLHNRIECAFPIYDQRLKEEIREIIDIQLHDNTKARLIDSEYDNKYASVNGLTQTHRAQYETYEYLKRKASAG